MVEITVQIRNVVGLRLKIQKKGNTNGTFDAKEKIKNI